jgi:naphthoate synthase
MGNVDAGYGSVHLARMVGRKKAREMWFCVYIFRHERLLQMVLINDVFKMMSWSVK